MQNKKFSPNNQSAFEARFEAQKIAFAPVIFQCVRYALQRGILDIIAKAGDTGLTVEEIATPTKLSPYAIKVVLETCLSAGVVYLENGRYLLDKVGFCLLADDITRTNFDFNADVCYAGLQDLDQSLDLQKPVGLKHLGAWSTIYEGLPELPEPAKSSWFTLDHLYSDTSFPAIMPDIFRNAPHHVMDIGANTGKFSLVTLQYNPDAHLHLVDLPVQLAVARQNLQQAQLLHRANLHPVNLLDSSTPLPEGMDVIWMSQFLSCFSEDAIASILQRAKMALAPGGEIIIMDTFWDCQQYDIAAFCLINLTPYFTAMASGNSKVYESTDYIRLAESVGLHLTEQRDNIGYCHSIQRFSKK